MREREDRPKFFNRYKKILEDITEIDRERKRLRFTTTFEFEIKLVQQFLANSSNVNK